jgi:rod shape-determining protein MreC
MQQIVNFILKNKYFLFFLLLEVIAISLTIQAHSYHNSKFSNSANFLSGGIYKKVNRFKEYRTLRESNLQLLEENARLKNILSQELKSDTNTITDVIDTTKYFQKHSYTSAKVIDNQYQRKYNYLTIDKGALHGVKTEMGVANSKGIIGITKNISDKYATILSILNENSKINVKLSNSFHFGTLQWNAKDYNVLQLVDLPIQANIKLGDTLITGGKSVIFPEGIPVGTIHDFKVSNNNYSYIDVKLFNDMSAIGPVHIIVSIDKKEIEELLETTIDD